MSKIHTNIAIVATASALLLSACGGAEVESTPQGSQEGQQPVIEKVRLTEDIELMTLAAAMGHREDGEVPTCTLRKGNSLELVADVMEVSEYISQGKQVVTVRYVDTGWSYDDECSEDDLRFLTPEVYENTTK